MILSILLGLAPLVKSNLHLGAFLKQKEMFPLTDPSPCPGITLLNHFQTKLSSQLILRGRHCSLSSLYIIVML